jgi:hypothetical protein
LVLSLTSGCVALPSAPEDDPLLLADASAEGLLVDGGSERPPTGEPYRGPQCATTPPTASADHDASASPLDPSWGDASVVFDDSGRPMIVDDAGRPVDPPTGLPRPSTSGQLVITELMIDPSAVGDTDGEWIELWNASDAAVDLGGCTLDDGAKTPRTLESLVLESGAIATLARSTTAGFVPSLVVSLSLTNSADTVAITCDGVEIDRVSFGAGYPLVAGASLALDPAAWPAADNDDASQWCASTEVFAGDHGTPGAPNADCSAELDAGAL